MGRVRIGTSGWVYRDWKGPFYPEALPAKRWLGFYASRFETTEINGSFYRLPSEAAVKGWADTAPEGFVFAWKASRYITHAKKLKDVGDSLALVFGRMDPLGSHFGPVLFQLPPQLRRDDERLARFLDQLPPHRRCAVEFRDPSWYAPAVLDRLREHGAALCISDHAAAPSPWEATADFLYVRPRAERSLFRPLRRSRPGAVGGAPGRFRRRRLRLFRQRHQERRTVRRRAADRPARRIALKVLRAAQKSHYIWG